MVLSDSPLTLSTPTATPDAKRAEETSREKIKVLRRRSARHVHLAAKIQIYITILELINLKRYAKQPSIMRTKYKVVRYNVVLNELTRRAVSRSESRHKLRIYELNSLEQKVAFMNLPKTTRDIRKHYKFHIHRLLNLRKRIAERTRRHREDIKKIKRCIECSLGRRPNQPERSYNHKIMVGFALVYGTHRGFKKRARDRILERDVMQLVSMLVHAPSLCVFSDSGTLG